MGDAIKEFSIRSIDGSDSTREAFQALGYNAGETMAVFASGGDAANDAFFDVLDTLMEVDNEVKRDAIGVALFGTMWEDLGTEAMQAMADASQAAYDTQGALEQINAVQYGGLEASLEGVRRQAELALAGIGGQLAPYAQEGLEYLADVVIPAVSDGLEEIVPQVIEAAKWLWENRAAILAVATGVTTAVVAFKAMKTASAAVGAVKSLGTIFAAGAKSSGVLGTAVKLMGGKFAIIAAIIAAVAAAFVVLWNRSETFRTAVMNLWAKIQPLLQALGNLVSMIMNTLAPVLTNAANLLINKLGAAFVAVAPYIEGVITILTNLIEFVTNVFSGNWSAAWQNVVNIFGTVFGMIVNLAKVPINAVISAINWVISKINSISVTIPDWVPGVGGTTLGFNIPTIPALAAGGVATAPTLAMVGEGGEPEAIMPLSKLAALLDEWTKPKPGGGGAGQGGGTETITFAPVFQFYGPTTREEAVEAGRVSFAEFKRLYKQMKAEEARKSFTPA